MERPTCKGTRRDGSPCRSTAVMASGFCSAHDESYSEQKATNSAKGGRHRSNRERAFRNLSDDMKALGAKLLDAFDAVYAGRMDGRTAAALSSLASAYVRVWEAGRVSATLQDVEIMLKAFEAGDVEAFMNAADAVGKAA